MYGSRSVGWRNSVCLLLSGSAAGARQEPRVGRILYATGVEGVLLYVKSSLTGDEKDYIIDYKKRNPNFPHETTGDQFFSEEQLEAYRALGFHAVDGFFTGSHRFTWSRTAWPTPEDAMQRLRALALV